MSKDRFIGDGRVMLDALTRDIRPGTHPLRVRRGTARTLVHHFMTSGTSTHSGFGGTLWVILEHCRVNDIPHLVEGRVGRGFIVVGLQPGDEEAALNRLLAKAGLAIDRENRLHKTANVDRNAGLSPKLALARLLAAELKERGELPEE